MRQKDEDYKVELINDLPSDEEISFYTQGEFIDLCAGDDRSEEPRNRRRGETRYVCATQVCGGYGDKSH